jgi:glycosyltransferase involved in cell wall biosynthesis
MPLQVVFDGRRVRDFGIGTYIRNLLAGLGSFDTEDQFHVIVDPNEVGELPALPSNFHVIQYQTPKSRLLAQLRFPPLPAGLRPDLVHIPLNAVPLLTPKPYVVTIHDMGALLFADRRAGWRDELNLYWFRRGLVKANRVLAVSDATRRDVRTTLGIPEKRIRMIYNAPDPIFTARARALELDESYRIMERYQINYPFVLYAGNIRPQKNIPRLIEAFAVLRGELSSHPIYSDLRLIIIGDEISKFPSVRHAVIRSRVEQSVRFLGFVPITTLRIFYKAAAAFVFPSLYEGFGLPPLEAMASGTPVVTSSVSSLPEVVGDAAIIVNPENVFDIARGMKEVLLDEEVRQRCIARGFEQVNRFSWRLTAEKVLTVYREVAAAGRKPVRSDI